MAWSKKGSLVGPRGIGVVDLLANKLWSGTALADDTLYIAYVNTKTMLAATLKGFDDAPLVGWQFGSLAHLHGVCLKDGVWYHLYAMLTVTSNRVRVESTLAVRAGTGSGFDYGVSGADESSPAITAIYGI